MNEAKKLQDAINNSLSQTAVNLFSKGAKPILTLGLDANNKVIINYERDWSAEKITQLLEMVLYELKKNAESKIIVPSKIISL